jgi:hypothetical protein
MKRLKDFKGRRILIYVFGLTSMIGFLAAFKNDFVTSLAIIYAGFILFSGLLSEKSTCKTKTDLK